MINVSPVDDEDDEDYYSGQEDQGPLGLDESDDILATKDDG
jgi:hypothetical protein